MKTLIIAKKFFFATLIILFFFRCTAIKPGQINEVKLKDYSFETTPNDLDNVGFVFAVDNNKNQIPVTMLALTLHEGSIIIPQTSSSKDVSFGALIKFLGLSSLNLTASVDLNNNTKITTTFLLDNPKITRVFLTNLDSAIAARKTVINNALINQHLQNATIYVIVETIKSSKLTYDFEKTQIGKGSLNAAFQSIISTNDSLKWNNAGKSSLSYLLKKDLTVFYKIFKIDVLPGAAGMNFKRGEPVIETELVYANPIKK